jgi:hypothetical protein
MLRIQITTRSYCLLAARYSQVLYAWNTDYHARSYCLLAAKVRTIRKLGIPRYDMLRIEGL